MRMFLINIVLIISSSAIAAWLRMFDQRLFLQSWSNLIGESIKLWVAGFLISPLSELFNLWPIYVIYSASYFLIINKMHNGKPTIRQAIMLGVLLSSAMYIAINTLSHQWIMHDYNHHFKLFIIYSFSALIYGLLYYYLLTKRTYIDSAVQNQL
ncbi:hypothetical protein GCM10011375_32340 [Hymenobacter qilianensis]|uniref:Uncharacterized protein n=1 Tax=Hymenobacter qilianensis TaxID=1385715 RepID=A0ACB5PV49_9BACT|nr:hypothetical protein GCM10011375_32340 [Hymenobacter qilianensis]